jgi:tetratricopeptide (TPR) repeat protein
MLSIIPSDPSQNGALRDPPLPAQIVLTRGFTAWRKNLAGMMFALALLAALGPHAAQAQALSEPAAAATALEQARRLFAEGKRNDALTVVDRALERSPRDAALRFTRGVMLGEAGRVDEALQVFIGLTQDYPELPEPHNNLATLYAARGELDKARVALEDAVRALPSYALAHENLGDVYLRMAQRAWVRAGELDPRSDAPAKLSIARELVHRITTLHDRPILVNPPRPR